MTLTTSPISATNIERWINSFHEMATCAIIPDGITQERAISSALDAVGYPSAESMIDFYSFLRELKTQRETLRSLTVETLKKLQTALEAASKILKSELARVFPGEITQWGYMISSFCSRFERDLYDVIFWRIDRDDKVRIGWVKE